MLLELCDSQITYRQRYVMVAARAPVIDLVVLDPNNPRSVAYQLDRIEAHLAALPKQQADGRLSPPQQIAAAAATALRTAEPADIDDEVIAGIEDALLRLSEAIASTYLSQRANWRRTMGGAGVIYDVRQTTTYSYASKVAYAHHVLRLTPINRTRQRVHLASLEVEPAPVERREGKDFFGNHLTLDPARSAARQAGHQGDRARHGRGAGGG